MQSRSVLFAAIRIVDEPGACIHVTGKEPQRRRA